MLLKSGDGSDNAGAVAVAAADYDDDGVENELCYGEVV